MCFNFMFYYRNADGKTNGFFLINISLIEIICFSISFINGLLRPGNNFLMKCF